MFVASGLFRDLFGQQIAWLDKAVLLAIDGSRATIERAHPELARRCALRSSRSARWPRGGDEPLARNHVARHWVDEAGALLKQRACPLHEAGTQASLRVFGTAPGDYGAGINRLAERSGSWTDRKELAQVYLDRIGHAYRGGWQQPRRSTELLTSNLARRAQHLSRSRQQSLRPDG